MHDAHVIAVYHSQILVDAHEYLRQPTVSMFSTMETEISLAPMAKHVGLTRRMHDWGLQPGQLTGLSEELVTAMTL
jgi:hypothetical protein